jgi:hypothetical protein
MESAKVVSSPSNELISYDWKSALRGFILMESTAAGIFVVGILEQIVDKPTIVTSMDWKATGLSFLTVTGVAAATFLVNLIKKYLQNNQYIVN